MQGPWLIVLGCVALLTRVGMAMYACGVSRSKNAASALVRGAMDMAVAAVIYWAVGGRFFNWGQQSTGQRFFSFVLVLIATGPVVAATAERSRWLVVAVTSALLAGLIVPLAGRWAWAGILSGRGFVDVGGASVLHVSAGVLAAVAAGLVGPRSGKYNHDQSANGIPGHSIPLELGGVLLMVVGWIAYLVGAATVRGGNVENAALGPVLAGSTGVLAGLLYGRLRFGKPDIFLAAAGLLGALVAISATAGMVSNRYAMIIGAAAGVVVPWVLVFIELRFKVDDPGGTIAIHGVGGVIGTLAAAFVNKNIVIQLAGLGLIALLSFAVGVIVLVILKACISLRVTEDQEFDGLDLAEHDINAYPDFQQTMIKSYHLREM